LWNFHRRLLSNRFLTNLANSDSTAGSGFKMPSSETENQVIIHDLASSRWLHFTNPHQIIEANKIDEVLPALERIESLVMSEGWYAAGYISYEAAGAFDTALCTHAAVDLPLLWFGLYSTPGPFELPRPDFTAYSLGGLVPSVGKHEYKRAIKKIKQYIHSGETYQVNYTMQLQSSFSGDPWHLFLAMVQAQKAGYAAWVDTGRRVICSASPELFFRLEEERLICQPMKGTVKRGRTFAEDEAFAEWLQRSEKNRAENLMIVDMIRNDMGRVAEPGSVQTTSLFDVERRPTLWQMTSTVTARCSASLTEIMAVLFPCASITGAPKFRTTQIVAELELIPRGIYTGCIGYIAPGRIAQFNVAIRTAVVDRLEGRVIYGAGGGIVWDSDGEDEYNEALLKARVLEEQRPEFSLLETILWTPEDSYYLLEYHLRRLKNSAVYFDFQVDIDNIRSQLQSKADAFGCEPKKIRLLVSIAGGVQIAVMAVEKQDRPLRIQLAREPVDSSEIFLYHKTTCRQIYESAQKEFPDCDDVLLWNERGELTESCIANLVVQLDGKLLTPPVESGLLPGVFRASLIEQGRIVEQRITVGDLKRCTKIYLVNSVKKWREADLIFRTADRNAPD
jgi:para-aminobenzoate synthetase / 4-amino-4-deoxychorismate lyase